MIFKDKVNKKAEEKSPVISVVVPVYNVEKYIHQAVDSLIAQTYTNLEILCVNDGSRDNSLNILRDYAANDSRIKILDRVNGGYGKAMNAGIDTATGEWLAILEPDDYLPADAYQNLMEAAAKHNVEIVKGAFKVFEDGAPDGEFCATMAPVHCGTVFRPCSHQEYFSHTVATWAALYRLDFLRQHNIRYNETPGAAYQDISMFLLSGAYAQRVYCISSCVYCYRTARPQSSVSNAIGNLSALIREHNYMRLRLEQDPKLWQEVQGAFVARLVASMFYIFKRLNTNSQRLRFLRVWQPCLQSISALDQSQLRWKVRRRLRMILKNPTAYVAGLENKTSLFYRYSPRTREILFFGIPIFAVELRPFYRCYRLFGFVVYRTC